MKKTKKNNLEIIQDYSFKIILLGDSNVGKTSIYFYYTKKIFQEEYSSTVGVDFTTEFKRISGKNVRLKIWDTAGEEKFRSTISNYFKGADACFLVFDLTNIDSFNNLEIWYKLFSDKTTILKNNENIVVLGNKCDLKEKKIDKDLINKFIKDKKLQYFETSAKEGINIDESFLYMAENLLKQRENNENINISDDSEEQIVKLNDNYNKNLIRNKHKKMKCC